MLNWINKKRNQKGFTLVELVVVIAILGILAAIAIPRFGGFKNKARSSQVIVNAKQLATAAEVLSAEGKTYGGTGFTNADIFKMAGMTAKSGANENDGEISTTPTPTIDANGRFIFTYVIKIDNVTFTAVRNTDGEFDITWP